MIKSKLAVFSFWLSLMTLVFAIIVTIFSKGFIAVLGFYVLPVSVFVGIIGSIYSLVLVKRDKLDGKILAISAFIINSVVLGILFYFFDQVLNFQF